MPGQFLTFLLTVSLYRVLTILGDMRPGITEAPQLRRGELRRRP